MNFDLEIELLEEDPQSVRTILDIINQTTSEFKNIPSIDRMISNRYDQELEDVREWLSITEWSQQNLEHQEIDRIQEQLIKLGVIDSTLPPSEFLTNL